MDALIEVALRKGLEAPLTVDIQDVSGFNTVANGEGDAFEHFSADCKFTRKRLDQRGAANSCRASSRWARNTGSDCNRA